MEVLAALETDHPCCWIFGFVILVSLEVPMVLKISKCLQTYGGL